jgi:hypothetical protein
MIVKANNLVQNIQVLLAKAVETASNGGDYSDDWEKAMQQQTELLRVINEIKYKQLLDRAERAAGHLRFLEER